MSEWKECKLGDVAKFQRGHDLPKTEMNLGNVPVAGSNGIIGYHNIATTKGPGITIGRSGNIGTPRYYKTDFWAHNTVLYVKDFNGNDEKFVFYFLHIFDFSGFNAGSAVPTLNRNHIHEIPVVIPALPEQRAIAGVLSSLDDKIDLLHRQNKTLEGIAAALWREMFVEEASPNWKKGKLGDFAEINPLRSIKKGAIAAYLDMSNMPTDGPFPAAWIQREFTSGMKFKNGDTLIARITPCLENGKTAYVNFLGDAEIGWGSTEYIILSPKSGYCPEWFYFLARNDDFRDFAIQNMTGTSGRQRVSGESVAQYETLIPPPRDSEHFGEFVGPLMEHIKHNSFGIRKLGMLRDTLLPKLMFGEVRMKYEH